MKTRLSLICCVALAMLVGPPIANAQQGSPFQQVPFTQFGRDLSSIGVPGRVWFSVNGAEDGLGYRGSYLTLGGKTRLAQDRFDGRWLFEGRVHHSVESDGGFFANIGVERVFSIQAAGADIVMGFWFDYDNSAEGVFDHAFQTISANAAIKTRRWDLIANGYFPVGTADHTLGDPTGVECFFGNNIVLQPGIDSALEGFDVVLRMKPAHLAHLNGTVTLGGYGYSSEVVEYFGGGRIGAGVQLVNGMMVNSEVNIDDRFGTTGVVSVGWIFGANAQGTEYSGLGRDLEETYRNDHIVRLQQDLVLAIDPDTGAPYNVIFVDNSADALVEDGTFERRFTTLAAAEAASATDDIIFVYEGFGTSVGYRDGIVLKDRQMLLGDGVEHIIPIANPGFGTAFVLCNDVDGLRPLISGSGLGPAVTLADDNVVRGFVIDGDEGTGGMSFGILGDGFVAGAPITNGTIEDTDITNAVLDGVFLRDIAGDWNFRRNSISANDRDGIFITDACDPTSVFIFEDNVVNSNARDGIHFDGYDATSITFLRNITNFNGRDGVRMETYKGLTTDIEFRNHRANANLGFGINILGGDGNLSFLNSTITNNIAGGINIVDWTNTAPGDQTLIGTASGGSSTITGNGAGGGAGIDVFQSAGSQTLIVTDSTVDGNGFGLRATSDGILASLDTQVIDNTSFDGNQLDGMRFTALGGSFHSVLVDQPNALSPLSVAGNGSVAGHGISFFVGDDSGGLVSTLDATVRNVAISGSGTHGIGGSSIIDGSLQLLVDNSTITTSGVDGINLDLNNSAHGVLNSIFVQDTTITASGDNAIDIDTRGGTLTDIQVTSVTATGGANNGFDLTTSGNVLTPAIDNRTRLYLRNSTFSGFGTLPTVSHGLAITSNGDSHVLSQIEGNTFSGNSGDGMNVAVNGDSEQYQRITNNQMLGNAGDGYSATTTGTNELVAIFVNNGMQTMAISNGALSDVCLAMSNNGLGVVPPALVNGAAPADFRVELDGLTNGFSNASLGPGFTFGAFGSVCEGLQTTEETAFAADGFPPL